MSLTEAEIKKMAQELDPPACDGVVAQVLANLPFMEEVWPAEVVLTKVNEALVQDSGMHVRVQVQS